MSKQRRGGKRAGSEAPRAASLRDPTAVGGPGHASTSSSQTPESVSMEGINRMLECRATAEVILTAVMTERVRDSSGQAEMLQDVERQCLEAFVPFEELMELKIQPFGQTPLTIEAGRCDFDGSPDLLLFLLEKTPRDRRMEYIRQGCLSRRDDLFEKLRTTLLNDSCLVPFDYQVNADTPYTNTNDSAFRAFICIPDFATALTAKAAMISDNLPKYWHELGNMLHHHQPFLCVEISALGRHWELSIGFNSLSLRLVAGPGCNIDASIMVVEDELGGLAPSILHNLENPFEEVLISKLKRIGWQERLQGHTSLDQLKTSVAYTVPEGWTPWSDLLLHQIDAKKLEPQPTLPSDYGLKPPASSINVDPPTAPRRHTIPDLIKMALKERDKTVDEICEYVLQRREFYRGIESTLLKIVEDRLHVHDYFKIVSPNDDGPRLWTCLNYETTENVHPLDRPGEVLSSSIDRATASHDAGKLTTTLECGKVTSNQPFDREAIRLWGSRKHDVEVYELSGGEWVCTTQCLCSVYYCETTKKTSLILEAKGIPSDLLTSEIAFRGKFDRLGDNVIFWTEPDGRDFALKFEDPAGCSTTWELILDAESHLDQRTTGVALDSMLKTNPRLLNVLSTALGLNVNVESDQTKPGRENIKDTAASLMESREHRSVHDLPTAVANYLQRERMPPLEEKIIVNDTTPLQPQSIMSVLQGISLQDVAETDAAYTPVLDKGFVEETLTTLQPPTPKKDGKVSTPSTSKPLMPERPSTPPKDQSTTLFFPQAQLHSERSQSKLQKDVQIPRCFHPQGQPANLVDATLSSNSLLLQLVVRLYEESAVGEPGPSRIVPSSLGVTRATSATVRTVQDGTSSVGEWSYVGEGDAFDDDDYLLYEGEDDVIDGASDTTE